MSQNTNEAVARTEPVEKRGVYLIDDAPMEAHPLVLEDGSGDKSLLAEALAENLAYDDLNDLINDLIAASVDMADRSDGGEGGV